MSQMSTTLRGGTPSLSTFSLVGQQSWSNACLRLVLFFTFWLEIGECLDGWPCEVNAHQVTPVATPRVLDGIGACGSLGTPTGRSLNAPQQDMATLKAVRGEVELGLTPLRQELHELCDSMVTRMEAVESLVARLDQSLALRIDALEERFAQHGPPATVLHSIREECCVRVTVSIVRVCAQAEMGVRPQREPCSMRGWRRRRPGRGGGEGHGSLEGKGAEWKRDWVTAVRLL